MYLNCKKPSCRHHISFSFEIKPASYKLAGYCSEECYEGDWDLCEDTPEQSSMDAMMTRNGLIGYHRRFGN